MDGLLDLLPPADGMEEAFVTRISRILPQIARQMPRGRLMNAVTAPTDIEVLLRALQEPSTLGAGLTPEPDPLIEALLRGVTMKREMLQAEGGALAARALADFLGISIQALNKRRERNQVFWLEKGAGFCYPAFQIHEKGLLPGTAEVLSAFTVTDPWMRVHFMLTGDARLDGDRPLDRLRAGDTAPVIRAAAAFGTHGAA